MKAAIDIGSNTIQLLVGTIENEKVYPIIREIRTVRLGHGATEKRLESDSISLAIETLILMKNLLAENEICEVRVVATSAVRDAVNKKEFTDAVLEHCGWTVETLSGEAEARMTFLGAHSLSHDKRLPVLDIGGGSTELVFCENGTINARSANVGAVRAFSLQWSKETILEELKKCFTNDRAPKLVGVGGTITTTAALLQNAHSYSRDTVQEYIMLRQDICELRDQLLPLSLPERCSFSPLLRDRGTIIVQGLDILLSMWDILGLSSMTVSDAGILEGALLDIGHNPY